MSFNNHTIHKHHILFYRMKVRTNKGLTKIETTVSNLNRLRKKLKSCEEPLSNRLYEIQHQKRYYDTRTPIGKERETILKSVFDAVHGKYEHKDIFMQLFVKAVTLFVNWADCPQCSNYFIRQKIKLLYNFVA